MKDFIMAMVKWNLPKMFVGKKSPKTTTFMRTVSGKQCCLSWCDVYTVTVCPRCSRALTESASHLSAPPTNDD